LPFEWVSLRPFQLSSPRAGGKVDFTPSNEIGKRSRAVAVIAGVRGAMLRFKRRHSADA
jgi:hypothetical protein